jgi:DNA (cytosine-5)-methyltransferase 1
MRTVAFCEQLSSRQRLLSRRWPGVPIYPDVRELAGFWIWPDLVCGGFPCQDLSRAGRRAGLNGSRSGLWREFVRVVSESEPSWVVMENIHQGWREWVPVVRQALHELRYASVPLQMRAVDFGLPHRRSRVFVVAHAGREHLQQQRGWSRGPSRESALLLAQLGEAWRASRPSKGIAFPRVGRAGDGLPDRLDRLSGLGNAIVPGCAEFIGRWIMRADSRRGDKQ